MAHVDAVTGHAEPESRAVIFACTSASVKYRYAPSPTTMRTIAETTVKTMWMSPIALPNPKA